MDFGLGDKRLLGEIVDPHAVRCATSPSFNQCLIAERQATDGRG